MTELILMTLHTLHCGRVQAKSELVVKLSIGQYLPYTNDVN